MAAGALVVLTAACGSGVGEDKDLPVEVIVASTQFAANQLTPGNAAEAKAAASKGMATRAAVEAVGAIAGPPKHSGGGAINWFTRTDDDQCMNLMLLSNNGRVRRVHLETFTQGSMGEAKCQTFGA